MVRARLLLAASVVAAAWLLAACSGGTPRDSFARPVETPEPTPTPVYPTPTPAPEPRELRVAYLNLMSPVATDANDQTASETFEERLQLVVDELRAFRPDVVAFSEATWTAQHGSAVAKLAAELRMEPVFVQANPWFAGQTEAQNRELAKQIGFAEGELVLVRSDVWVVLVANQGWLNPRTSETEARAALHVQLKGPPSVGTVDIFVTHLTGGGERVRAAQAESFAAFVREHRGDGPAVVMGDLGDGPGSAAYAALMELGLDDPLAVTNPPTCCRPGVVGEQPEPTERTSFLLSAGWKAAVAGPLAYRPGQRKDGTPLYASDHNGAWALFRLPPGDE
ncbi:endonuclease/exonuclease/phosphatase family protein [Tepidiforma sp.]|uniref:endonuclease/exonuclease/phosphatase family protein n=1 Tax=Tepidiforma sp. TaxID=2682230 RepID=UPI003A101E4A